MAKAYWNPGWCRGDLFLESSRPHRAFYLLIGWLTQTFTLEQTAIIGRISSLGLVAWGWSRLCLALRLSTGQSILAATLLLLIQSAGSWSGEWLIGGVESKVFSTDWCLGPGGPCWKAVATRPGSGSAWRQRSTRLWASGPRWRRCAPPPGAGGGRRARPHERTLRCPGFRSTSFPRYGGSSPPHLESAGRCRPESRRHSDCGPGDFIQVSYRLAHHLDPWTFPAASHWLFVGLLLISLLTWWLQRSRPGLRLIDSLTAAAVLFGLTATVLSYGRGRGRGLNQGWGNCSSNC